MVFRIEKAISRPRGYAHLILDALITKQSDWTSHLSTKPYLFVDECLILSELSTKPYLFVDETRYDLTLGELVIPYNQAIS